MLFLRTTAVDAPGVATSGTTTTANAQRLTGTSGVYPPGVLFALALRFRRLGGALALGRARPGADLRGRVLRHLQVVLEGRQRLAGPGLQIRILARGRFLAELGDVFLVVGHHVLHVRLVERSAVELGETIVHGLVLGVELGRQRHALLRGPLLEFVVGLAVVGHHSVTELFYVCAR